MDITLLPSPTVVPKLTRVAAYVRVSRDSERLTHSHSAQVSHYNQLIAATPGWTFAGIYTDLGQTGTTTHRDGFTRLIADALAGNIDIILTKSISRFARNTVDLLATVRDMKQAGVAVRFEREHIDTLTADGEVLLTLLASFAQAESESISANTTWGIRSKYPHGRPHSRRPYGYRFDHGMLHIINTEASIVKRVFDEFLAGHSPEATVERLNAEGLRSRSGAPFRASVTRTWLENPTYIGTLICQAYYRPHIANPTGTRNTGQLPKYIITDHHTPIIDKTVFDAVQAELARRRASGGRALTPTGGTNALTHRIHCTTCGRHYQRRTKARSGRTYKYWWCETATKGHGNPCDSHQLRETHLQHLITTRLRLPGWDNATIVETITRIDAGPDYQLTAHLSDGSTIPLDYAASGKEAC
ncbi:MAG: Site-specific recombinase [Actinomyces urogenitalis DORA_12]|uniref:Site-specific recombinase n=2 Tax=root TaxID=1 RepID=W1VDG7_9ACTO|nr:recombinase family protein [uncultured Actinomyces sp.]ETJ02054.1 MAG: Site-specific recombinase [Actinomyces urogenitalis DORA_12]